MAISMAEIGELTKVLAPVVAILIATSTILQTLERARRELAVNLIYNWANHTDWVTSRSVAIATELPSEVINAINAKRCASIPDAHYDSIVAILRTTFPEKDLPARPSYEAGPSDKAKCSEGKFQISGEQSAFIRFQWVRWLNRLEGTLAAWQQGAADTELMALEFAPLVKGSSAELEVLAKVRDGLPVIAEFYRQQRDTGGIKVRPRLGIFPWRP
jgi:hypothetical protein